MGMPKFYIKKYISFLVCANTKIFMAFTHNYLLGFFIVDVLKINKVG